MPDLIGSPHEIVADSHSCLELPAVLEEVSACAMSLPGKEAVLASEPLEDIIAVESELALVGQLKEVIGLDGPFGLADLVPMEGIVERIDSPASILDSEEILALSDLLSIAASASQRLAPLEDRYDRLRGKAEDITPLPVLQGRIHKVLDEHGMVRASASPRLMEIHSRMRGVRDRILRTLEGVIEDQDLSRVVQEDYISLRNDRYVILLRPEFKGLLDGIVHDHSRSGASVYVEPLSAVELNNRVASLVDEEREEVRRIFSALTDEVRNCREVILANYRSLTRLDAYQARAIYASATAGIVPELQADGFRILGARHPLLLADSGLEVVPMDVIQDGFTCGTVISGANMGGKTVALKIAGLFPLMARCAIPIPALEGSKICPFVRIMADIGDEQDIRGRISSFSGHMLRIKAIMDHVRSGDLCLLDELGGATDPEEGSALAMAILDHLVESGAKVIVTTHLTHLKAYAMARPNLKNVSVEFHPETMKPTFRLLYDLPGESYAIVTAERIGIPKSVVVAARGYLGRAAGGSSALMESLRRKMLEVESLASELAESRTRLEDELAELARTKEEAVEALRVQAKDALRAAEKAIAELEHSLKDGSLKRGPRVRRALDLIRADVEGKLGVPLDRPVPVPQPGSRVKVKSLGKEGVVSSVLDKGRVEVSFGSMTFKADLEDLLLILGEPRNKKGAERRARVAEMPPAAPSWQVHIIGMRADEAIPIVEKAIDEALLGGLASLSIIHGKGTGRLKKAVWDYLAGHSFVTEFHSGDALSGGAGVTEVTLVSG